MFAVPLSMSASTGLPGTVPELKTAAMTALLKVTPTPTVVISPCRTKIGRDHLECTATSISRRFEIELPNQRTRNCGKSMRQALSDLR